MCLKTKKFTICSVLKFSRDFATIYLVCIYLNKARKYIKTKQIKGDTGMNRIYKVIWSKVKNCYVVVSEFAKRNSKSTVNSGFSVTRNILAGAVVLGLTAGVYTPVWAEVHYHSNAGEPTDIYFGDGDQIHPDESNGKIYFTIKDSWNAKIHSLVNCKLNLNTHNQETHSIA